MAAMATVVIMPTMDQNVLKMAQNVPKRPKMSQSCPEMVGQNQFSCLVNICVSEPFRILQNVLMHQSF
jgi:hypothetical protein